MVAEEVLVFDNLAGTLTIVVNANAEELRGVRCGGISTERIARQLSKPGPNA